MLIFIQMSLRQRQTVAPVLGHKGSPVANEAPSFWSIADYLGKSG